MNVKLNLDGKEKCVLFVHKLDLQEFLIIYELRKPQYVLWGFLWQQTQPFKEYELTSSVLYMPIPQPPAGKS